MTAVIKSDVIIVPDIVFLGSNAKLRVIPS